MLMEQITEADDIVGEGPVWCPEQQALFWVDIRGQRVRRWTPLGTTSWEMPGLTGSLAVARSGGLIVAVGTGLYRFDPEMGELQKMVSAPGAENPQMRLNDGKCDRRGRFWVGLMNDVVRDIPAGSLCCFDTEQIETGLNAVVTDLILPNGLCWSPDNTVIYFADSFRHTIYSAPYHPESGTLGERRVFARTEAPAMPDGATVDEEGFLWSADYGGWSITRYAPDGTVDRKISLPVKQPTSCAFGGPDLATLFVTSARQRLSEQELEEQPGAGAVFAMDVGVRGVPEPQFNG